jgi:spermidine/putrescine ABC transporter ATP-binding subunit
MPDERRPHSGLGSLELSALRKTYGETVAVREVSLDIRKGEFITLLGQSGSGKTTTLMMVAGFVEPDAGHILLDGSDLVGVPTYRRSIGVVFQSYALFPHMTVFENVSFPLRMRDMQRSDIDRLVKQILELVQLQEFEHRRPSQLSGGQQQRVALARALVFQPSVLLLDEPLGALDRLLREEMKLELRRVHQELGTTMIYVTHDQDEALMLSDRIAVMRGGAIEQVGSPDRIYQRPKSLFVARFVGEGNLVSGRISSLSGGVSALALGDTQIRGAASDGLSAGDEATMFIRPEKIVMIAPGGPGSALEGVVHDKIYGGEMIRYHVRIDSLMMVIKQPNRLGVFHPEVGARVTLNWDAQDATVFAE